MIAHIAHVADVQSSFTGGMLWFPDLGQVGMDLATLQCPLGLYGIALPAAVTLAMFANIDRSFGEPVSSKAGDDFMTAQYSLNSHEGMRVRKVAHLNVYPSRFDSD